MTDLLMPKATAVWLIDNTALTFSQIADFCSLHDLEVQARTASALASLRISSIRHHSIHRSSCGQLVMPHSA